MCSKPRRGDEGDKDLTIFLTLSYSLGRPKVRTGTGLLSREEAKRKSKEEVAQSESHETRPTSRDGLPTVVHANTGRLGPGPR